MNLLRWELNQILCKPLASIPAADHQCDKETGELAGDGSKLSLLGIDLGEGLVMSADLLQLFLDTLAKLGAIVPSRYYQYGEVSMQVVQRPFKWDTRGIP